MFKFVGSILVFCVVAVNSLEVDGTDVEMTADELEFVRNITQMSRAGFWIPVAATIATTTTTTTGAIATASTLIPCSPSNCCTWSCSATTDQTCALTGGVSGVMCIPYSTMAPLTPATACIRSQCAACSSTTVSCTAATVCNDITSLVCDFSRV